MTVDDILTLNKDEQYIYNSALVAISRGETELTFPRIVSPKTAMLLIKLIIARNPDFFYYNNCMFQYAEKRDTFTVVLSKWTKEAYIETERKRFIDEARRIIAEVIKPNMTTRQKVFALHKYLVDNVVYYDGKPGTVTFMMSHTAYGTIINKRGVCEGISAAYVFLLSLAGVNATCVCGSTQREGDEDHMWNIVERDGRYCHVDATWDLKHSKHPNMPAVDYFALSDEDLRNREWNKSWYPKCDSKSMNYFYVTNSVANSVDDIRQIAERQMQQYNFIYIKIPGMEFLPIPELNQIFIKETILPLMPDNVKRALVGKKGLIDVNADQRIIKVVLD